MDLQTKKQEMARLQAELQRLDDEINKEEAAQGWQPSSYYTAYYATAGFMLGSFGAMASLLFNVIGADRRQEPAGTRPDLPDLPARRRRRSS